MAAQDSFISDDDEDLCPLCIEEMDISDKNFKPCPCGYQICQFCFNNIRQNPELNGQCPACRRKYDDSSVEYRQITAEEWRKDHLRQARREKERKQREREKKEPDQPVSKKHLSGMRVIQKNLVYVIGLNPNIPTDELHNTLRGDQFFGQYGRIQKIVINKRTNASGNPGIGVYVTFANKDDAARCIAAVDGSVNDGKYLRAAYGTTKYCSSYLRGQACPNPHCMFLHEPGEEADSYTRRDLSALHHRHDHPNSQGSSSGGTHALPSLSSAAAQAANGTPAPAAPAVAVAPVPVASAWGKPLSVPTPSRPPVEKDVSSETVVKLLDRQLEALAQGDTGYTFSSKYLSEQDLADAALPTFFSLFMDSGRRNIIFEEARGKLAKFASESSSVLPSPRIQAAVTVGQANVSQFANKVASESQGPIAQPEPSKPASAAPFPASLTPPGLFTPPPGSSGHNSAQNSHELLAHLMKGKSGGSQSVY